MTATPRCSELTTELEEEPELTEAEFHRRQRRRDLNTQRRQRRFAKMTPEQRARFNKDLKAKLDKKRKHINKQRRIRAALARILDAEAFHEKRRAQQEAWLEKHPHQRQRQCDRSAQRRAAKKENNKKLAWRDARALGMPSPGDASIISGRIENESYIVQQPSGRKRLERWHGSKLTERQL